MAVYDDNMYAKIYAKNTGDIGFPYGKNIPEISITQEPQENTNL